MKVEAKCVQRAWDSDACVMCEPGMGPLPGGLYLIERGGKLATLKTALGKYVFEFDRALPGQTIDYTCEKCGEKCKSLNELGNHSYSKHPEGNPVAEPEQEPFADRTCTVCGKVCKSPYGLRLHTEGAHSVAASVGTEQTEETVSA